MTTHVAHGLLTMIESASESLRAINDPEAALKSTPDSWAKKEVLGHLLDSAVNNHHRFIRAQEVAERAFPAYAQAHWVKAQGYAERPWLELVELWRLYNCHLAHVIRRIPAEKLAVPCVIGSDEPVTLGYLVEDYLIHLRQHLHELE